MAILFRAQLRPSKLELIVPWLVEQPWAYPSEEEWRSVATYRFDDPAGEVGIETFILSAGQGEELHVPVSYRGAPLEGADAALIGTMDHSVLGKRWAYDATGDPVYAQVLASTIVNGGTEAELYVEKDGQRELMAGTAQVRGSGSESREVPVPSELHVDTSGTVTTITTEDAVLSVIRRVGDALPGDVAASLTGVWESSPGPTPLAGYTPRD
ncbi:hypothetical protein FVA74_09435 [Salinibacterium sp. dk2585]|uniref:CG0192-related protein n=1 Tax=unclassified Salinibacterium TaxID=2632331 RepID=UPI0011C2524F|nr:MULTISPECIES: hypothetical protein [unclassified Salinibacterium]QEE61768.1 hypothetical protein FVA74_09435 [Salinibacterium sp. dk2585]TXK54677.1 hypothetical protein FVP63_06525 [Salinibacterium sp. dk5596]